MTDALLITVAPTGAETAKADCPQLPTTPGGDRRTAAECEAAGAAMIHLHVRDAEHAPTLDQALLREWVAAVRESTVARRAALHRRLGPRPARRAAQGARRRARLVQPHDGHDQLRRRRVPQPVAVREATSTSSRRSAGSCPEFELFDLGHVHALRPADPEYGLPYGGKVHVDFVMGVPGGMPGTAAALVAGVAALPPEVTSLVGHRDRPLDAAVALASLSMGGHLRVGMEDVLTISRGVPVESNAAARRPRRRPRPDRPAYADVARPVPGAARAVLRSGGRGGSCGSRTLLHSPPTSVSAYDAPGGGGSGGFRAVRVPLTHRSARASGVVDPLHPDEAGR